jgi:hypothetical protein
MDLNEFIQKKGHSGIEIKQVPAVIEDCFMEFMMK